MFYIQIGKALKEYPIVLSINCSNVDIQQCTVLGVIFTKFVLYG